MFQVLVLNMMSMICAGITSQMVREAYKQSMLSLLLTTLQKKGMSIMSCKSLFLYVSHNLKIFMQFLLVNLYVASQLSVIYRISRSFMLPYLSVCPSICKFVCSFHDESLTLFTSSAYDIN
jgi:hypothetical protein